jgi:hypothetical protein
VLSPATICQERWPLPLPDSLRELRLESASCIDHSRLYWQRRLAAGTVPLLVMRAPIVICKIGGGAFLKDDGHPDEDMLGYGDGTRFVYFLWASRPSISRHAYAVNG